MKSEIQNILMGILALVSVRQTVVASAFDHWHWRNPMPQGNSLHHVGFNNDRFVAVGELGTVLTSPDGLIWIQPDSGTTGTLTGSAFGNGLYVIVGNDGAILTSVDGVTWHPSNSGVTNTLAGVAWGNGAFVAVGAQGTILISTNGMDWLQQTSPTNAAYSGITFGNGTFVAVGGNEMGVAGSETLISSTNGVDWTLHNVVPSDSSRSLGALNNVAFAENLFVAVGYEAQTITGSIMVSLTSTNGSEWTSHSLGGAGGNQLYGVNFGRGLFVAVNGFSALTSSDGANWFPHSSGGIFSVAFGNGVFVA